MKTSALLLAAVLLCRVSIAQEATAPVNAADLDFQAFENTVHTKLPKPADQMTPREAALFLEGLAMEVRRKALAFLSQHPDDPRRWRIAMALDPKRPCFVLEWGEEDADGSPRPKAVDEAAAAGWKAMVDGMKEELRTSRDLPEDIRRDLAASAERQAKRAAYFAKWRSGREKAPDFTAYDLNGKPVRISDYRGQVVVLDFWASWCIPCRISMPHVQRLASAYRKQGVVIIGSGTNDLRADFETFVKQSIAKYPDIVWTHDRAEKSDARASRALYGVMGIPSQFVIDRKGYVVDVIVGNSGGGATLEGALARAGVDVPADIARQAAR